jgi:hypothetical protein
MIKLNKLLYLSTDEDVFIDHIRPTPYQKDTLVKAKNDIRDYIKPLLRDATVSVLEMKKAVTPRFRTQGSWSYQTCVQPAWEPPQEMDWDFGIYLPVTVWEENGPPDKMAKLYFDLVERLLAKLCQEKGWRLNNDKDSCIRVHINNWAHIDIPLYAAPEFEFEKVHEKVALEAMTMDSRSELLAEFAEEDFTRQQWEDMENIMMATRSGLWKESDPDAVSKWFIDRVTEHKEQLRRVCLYLKAWRDFNWKSGGPTSVSIMIAVAQAFEPHYGRDDIALENAARVLADAIKGDIREVAIDGGLDDFNRLNESERHDASRLALKLAHTIHTCRLKMNSQVYEVLNALRSEFGTRLPNRAELIEIDSGAESIRQTFATRVPRPVVNATSAG